jgi:hypothetical protein
MKSLRRCLVAVFAVLGLSAGVAGSAMAGQPGSSAGVMCQNFTDRPGNASSNNASVFSFNPLATAGLHYAGNPGTGSLNSGNPKAVSQYDIACFQVSSNPGH